MKLKKHYLFLQGIDLKMAILWTLPKVNKKIYFLNSPPLQFKGETYKIYISKMYVHNMYDVYHLN